MKFECLQENLNKGLSLTSHLVRGDTTLPILNNILLQVKGGILELISTNLEIGIKTIIRGKVIKEGKYTVPAQLLTNYVSSLGNKNLIIEVKEGSLVLKTENSTTKIKGQEAEEFPLIPKIEKDKKYQIEKKDLKNGLKQVLFSVKINEVRPEISGVLFKFQGDKLILVGTDSFRLTEKKINLQKNSEDIEIIVPIKTLQELSKILEEDDGMIEIYIKENQILFTSKETELISRLISGKYPDYTKIIPQESKTKAIISTDNFIKIIKGASLFSQKEVNDLNIEFQSQKGLIKINTLNTQKGENISQIKADLSGEDNQIVLNWRYLLDVLQNIDNPEVVLELINKDSPLLLKPQNKEDYLYVIMPIRE